jgi:predicted MFS family arabinose efflux permease
MLGILVMVFGSLIFGIFAKELNRRNLLILIGFAAFIVFGYYSIRRFL